MQSRRRYRFRWFRLTVMLIVGYSLYILVNQQLEINAVKHDMESTRARVEQLKTVNKSYADKKVRLNTPAYVEKLARDGLGLVKPGEVPYIPPEKNNQ